LTASENVTTTNDDIVLTAVDAAAGAQHVTVDSGVTVKSTNGNVTLRVAT